MLLLIACFNEYDLCTCTVSSSASVNRMQLSLQALVYVHDICTTDLPMYLAGVYMYMYKCTNTVCSNYTVYIRVRMRVWIPGILTLGNVFAFVSWPDENGVSIVASTQTSERPLIGQVCYVIDK